MKVLLINGSPHQAGCTYTALKECADSLKQEGIQTEILWLGVLPVAGCIACGSCKSTGRCFVDDQVNQVVEQLPQIDGIIVGSPVYYSAPAGQLVSFLDRLFYVAGRTMAMKAGASVVSCRRGGATAAFEQLNQYFLMNNMPLAPSRYWNQVYGNTPEEARQDLEGLHTMRVLGKNMAFMLKAFQMARANGLSNPEYGEKVSTNFIR